MELMDQECELVSGVLEKRPGYFDKLIGQYEKLVRSIIHEMVVDSQDREEYVQDVFVKVFERLKSFRFESKLSTWIARIAYNHGANYCRKKRIKFLELDQQTDLAECNEPAQLETGVPLNIAMQKLNPEHRMIITMFYVNELSYVEIAKVLDIPAGTVKSKLFRAKESLKKMITPFYDRS